MTPLFLLLHFLVTVFVNDKSTEDSAGKVTRKDNIYKYMLHINYIYSNFGPNMGGDKWVLNTPPMSCIEYLKYIQLTDIGS